MSQSPLMDRCRHCGAVLDSKRACPNQDRKAHHPPTPVPE